MSHAPRQYHAVNDTCAYSPSNDGIIMSDSHSFRYPRRPPIPLIRWNSTYNFSCLRRLHRSTSKCLSLLYPRSNKCWATSLTSSSRGSSLRAPIHLLQLEYVYLCHGTRHMKLKNHISSLFPRHPSWFRRPMLIFREILAPLKKFI